jgi:hypothetical protein
MGKLFIKKYQNNNPKNRTAYGKTYGRVGHIDTIDTDGLARHIMEHGSVYTDDVVLGVTRKLAVLEEWTEARADDGQPGEVRRSRGEHQQRWWQRQQRRQRPRGGRPTVSDRNHEFHEFFNYSE